MNRPLNTGPRDYVMRRREAEAEYRCMELFGMRRPLTHREQIELHRLIMREKMEIAPGAGVPVSPSV